MKVYKKMTTTAELIVSPKNLILLRPDWRTVKYTVTAEKKWEW